MEPLYFMIFGALLTLSLVWAKVRYADFPAQKPRDYRDQSPKLDIRQELNGTLQCEGVIYGPTGRVSSRFVAEMRASWEGNTGKMTESFRYTTATGKSANGR